MELIKLKFVDLKHDFITNSKCILTQNDFNHNGGKENRYVLWYHNLLLNRENHPYNENEINWLQHQ